MSEQALVTIVLALLGAVTGAGFWGYMSSRKEAPIKKRDADVAVAHTSQTMALDMATRLQDEVARISTDLNTERSERIKLSKRVDKQESTIQGLRAAVRAFREAWSVLTRDWHILRLQETPPAEPIITFNFNEEPT